MKKIFCILFIAFFTISVFSQTPDDSDKIGILDSTYITDGLPFEFVRHINFVNPRSVYDGDTPTLEVVLGYATIRIERFRLYGIQAPEIRRLATRPQGEASRLKLIELINSCDRLFIHTFPDKQAYEEDKGKYGRYLGVLYGICGDLIISLNDRMVECGHAIYKDY